MSDEHPSLVVVKTYGSRPAADLAKSMLEDAGIPAMSTADTAGGMREHLAWSGAGFQIIVREEDAAEALEILKPITDAEDPGLDSGDDPFSPKLKLF